MERKIEQLLNDGDYTIVDENDKLILTKTEIPGMNMGPSDHLYQLWKKKRTRATEIGAIVHRWGENKTPTIGTAIYEIARELELRIKETEEEAERAERQLQEAEARSRAAELTYNQFGDAVRG